ncbi:hypothetical protein L8106_23101 [Lyngbya sp. PCC 8106]|nr:hypothetical protein L8106_23101 [Lyngbya sp. PCC 8106]
MNAKEIATTTPQLQAAADFLSILETKQADNLFTLFPKYGLYNSLFHIKGFRV